MIMLISPLHTIIYSSLYIYIYIYIYIYFFNWIDFKWNENWWIEFFNILTFLKKFIYRFLLGEFVSLALKSPKMNVYFYFRLTSTNWSEWPRNKITRWWLGVVLLYEWVIPSQYVSLIVLWWKFRSSLCHYSL